MSSVEPCSSRYLTLQKIMRLFCGEMRAMKSNIGDKNHSKGPERDKMLKWVSAKWSPSQSQHVERCTYSFPLPPIRSLVSSHRPALAYPPFVKHQPERKTYQQPIDTGDPPMNWSSLHPKQGLTKKTHKKIDYIKIVRNLRDRVNLKGPYIKIQAS